MRELKQPPLFVTGAPRSGTSWIGLLLGQAARTRYVYEPFNAQWSPRLDGSLSHFEYLTREAKVGEEVNRLGARAFAGRQSLKQLQRAAYRGYLVPTLRPFDYLVVKDPTAVLMSDWIASTFGARVINVIRHPCAFAASIHRLGWKLSVHRFLNQPALVNDHLAGYEKVIRTCEKDSWERAAAVWSIINRVLARQVEQNSRFISIRYEDVCRDINTVAEAVDATWDLGSSLAYANRKATGAGKGRTDSGSLDRQSSAMPDAWRDEISEGQRDAVRGVVQSLNADEFYSEAEW